MDKNKAILNYLIQCPQIQNNPLFFNFADAGDNNKQLVITSNSKSLNKKYVDGSELKRFTFTIVDYRSIVFQAVVKQSGYPNENIEEAFDIQGIIDWITEQNELRNFPNFGTDCIVEEIQATTENPNLNGVDDSLTPAIAIYSIVVQVDYLDKSKILWR